MADKTAPGSQNSDQFPEIKPTKPTDDTAYISPIIGKLGYDTERPWLFGLGTSPNNGVDFHVFLSFDGLSFDESDVDKLFQVGASDRVKKMVDSATAEIPQAVSNANEAVKRADSAVSVSKVNSDAIVAQSEAISEIKSAMDSATAEIQQTAANAASDAAKIRADVARVQNEVDTAKTANSASVEALKSDIDTAKQDLANVHDSLTKAQSAVEQNQKLINDSVAKISNDIAQDRKDMAATRDQLSSAQDAIAKNRQDLESNVAEINSDIAQDRKDITEAQQANADTAKKLDSYTKQAIEQGKTIKDLQTDDDSTKLTIADIKGNVSQVQDSVTGLTASLKDANDNLATVKALADSLSATLTDHSKNIASLQATAKELSSTLGDADGRLSKVEQTAEEQSTTLSTVQGNLSQVKQTADGLTDTLKDAQGDIAKVQATAKGLSEQITTAQGAITDLQTDVTGVKATIADHGKNIHTLQADSKTLKDDMTDAKGNISSLQKTSTSLTSEMQDHSGRLSKVEQTATEHTSTLSDLQGNLSQVKQTATGLVTTLKDAQGNIDQLQQDAKGTAEQISNVQGDITALQKDVGGIKLTIADHEKNIHTLQADSKSLRDDMKDAQGNISSLQKTATSLDSEFEDHDGRLSKVEQTASTLTNEFSDQQGHLNRVEQKATGTEQTIANQQGQINNIKTDAAGIHETITGQGNQIANINVTLNGLNSKYEGVSGDLGKLKAQTDWKIVTGVLDANQYTKTAKIFYQDWQAKNTPNVGWFYLIVDAPRSDRITQTLIRDNTTDTWTRVYNGAWQAWTKGANNLDVAKLSDRITTNSTQITQNQQAIALKADQSTVNNLTGEVSQNKAQLKVQAGQISSKVSSEDFKTLDNKVGGAIAQIDKNTTAIDQTNKQISLKADQTEVNQVKQTATQNSSRLNVMANEISSKVTSTDVNNIVDSKGYATTSTVQSLITQKAGTINESITNLTNEVNTRNGVNLLKGTKNFSGSWHNDGSTNYWHTENWIDPNGNHSVKSDAISWNGYYQPIYLDTGDYTFSGYYYSEGGKPVFCYIRPNSGDNLVEVSYNSNLDSTPNGWRWFVVHFKVTKAGNAAVRLESGQNQILHIASYKLEKGTVTNPVWTPAPSDNATVTQVQQITASIDGIQSTVANKADKSQITQLSNVIQSKVSSSDFNDLKDKTTWKSTDSIDLNNAVSQQKIFVKGGSNLPPGDYWWYVQVESGYDSRIVQYAVSDRDNIHYSRQYDGSKWSAWSQGATESEITQLRDDINLRVKSGDLLSQINLTAHNTLIQSNKIYLDSSSTVFSGKAFIPSAAITSLDAGKITTGYIRVPMSDGNGNSVQVSNNGVDIVSNNQNTKLFSANRGIASVHIDAAGMNFGATTNGTYELLGGLSPLLDDTDGGFDGMSNHNGIGFVVETQQQYGSPYGGDFFSLARSIKGPPSYYNGFLYEATGSGKHEIGSHFFDPIWIHPWGADNYMHATWVSWTAWDNNEKYPAIVQAGSNMGGICFPKSGEVTLFTASGKSFTPSQWKGAYTGYQHDGAGNAYHDPSQDA